MHRFMLAINGLGLIIAAIARFLRDNGVACAKIGVAYTVEKAAVGAGWLAAKLEAAAQRIDNAKRIAA